MNYFCLVNGSASSHILHIFYTHSVHQDGVIKAQRDWGRRIQKQLSEHVRGRQGYLAAVIM